MTVGANELIARFRAADFGEPRELEAFIKEASPAPATALLKVLELLTSKGATAELERHRVRCAAFARLAKQSPDKSLFLPFVQALKPASSHLRAALFELIPAVNDITAHKDVCALLRSSDPQVRQLASQVIAEVGGKTALQLLSEWVEETGFPGRHEAVDALVRCAGHHAIPALHGVVKVGAPAEKTHALKYLGDLHYVAKDVGSALRAIADALEIGGTVRPQAIAAFCRLCTEDDYFVAIVPWLDSEEPDSIKAAVEGLRRFNSPRVLTALERKLRAGPNPVRFAVLETLEAIGADEVLPVLVDALGHRQVLVRTRAGEALSNLSRARKVDLARAIIWLVHSPDVNVRRMAVDLARSVPDQAEPLWPRLLRLLRDEDWWVRERVAEALVEMAGAKLTPHVTPYLSDPSDTVRRYAIEMLIRLADPQSLGPLLTVAASDPDWWVRERAIDAVAKLKSPRAIPRLVELLEDPEVRIACLEALTALEARSAASQVVPLLESDDPDVRLAAARCLASFDDRAYATHLDALLDDPDERVRAAVREALERWRLAISGGGRGHAIDALLVEVGRRGADDLLLAPGHPPAAKQTGRAVPLDPRPLTADQTEALLRPVMRDEHRALLEAQGDADFSYECTLEPLRFRVNVYKTVNGLSAAFRIIRGVLMDFDSLGLPPAVRRLTELKNGLVVIGGPTGSGKSTTLAALIDHINRTRSQHIITLEDPIELVHRTRKCLVNQREIGTHARSFASALRAALREDPDVILVGELRDVPTIAAAVSAAETGHLVFGTLHTVAADTSVDRLVNALPAGQQNQVRAMLAESLRAVVCQHLLPRQGGGRCLALEVMLNNDAVSNLIRKGKTYQLPSIISAAAEQGMQTMDSDLMRLVKAGLITAEDAYVKARNKKEFEPLLAAEEERQKQSVLPPLAPLLSSSSEQTGEQGGDTSEEEPERAAAPRGPAPAPQERPSAGPSRAMEPAPAPASEVARPAPSPAPERRVPAPVLPPEPKTPSPVLSTGDRLPPIVRVRPSGPKPAAPPRLASAPPQLIATPAPEPASPPAPPSARAAPKPPPRPPAPVLAPTPPPPEPSPEESTNEVTQPSLPSLSLEAVLEVSPAEPPPPAPGEAEAKEAWATFAAAADKARARKKVVAALDEVLSRHPSCAAAHYFMGQVHLYGGDPAAARDWFQRTLELDPAHSAARQRLAAMRE